HLSEQLNRQWSVAGLESIGLANDEAPLLTISEMASRYLTAMRSLQSTGPYTVLGYSMGGVIAYEMARQCMPDERIHLILLDTETPTFATEFDAKDAGFLREMIQSFEVQSGIEIPEEAAEALLTGFDLDQMDTVLSVEEIEDLVEQLMEAMGMDDDGDEMQGMKRIVHVLIANTQAIRQYQLAPLAVDLQLIMAGQRGEAQMQALQAAWQKQVNSVVVHHIAMADHAQLVESQFAAQLAILLNTIRA
ncbi:MAG: hypothetical protein HN790_03995, partial [Methylococcales bacterium]|nr:hypothetical protein [Methylococcales bacterium]